MGEALYRKHRVKKLQEMVGQQHITTTLANAIKEGRISHAYLFTGPRGTGKTSVARILAHEINRLPYDGTNHLDIIEIDAASNRRIDEIRDLRDKIHIAPTQAPYKVYIIDEAHMLTKEAFNALLKTLEEPPAHAIFILATTEVHKLPDTIISRTQRFNFKPAEAQLAASHLAAIAKKEGLSITPEALALLAEHGRGSFRDSISMLDQASSHGKDVSVETVQTMLGLAPQTAINQLSKIVQNGTPQQLMSELESLNEAGYNAAQVASQLSATLRQLILQGAPQAQELLNLIETLLGVPSSSDPARKLELSLLGHLLQNTPLNSSATTSPAPSTPESTPRSQPKQEVKPPAAIKPDPKKQETAAPKSDEQPTMPTEPAEETLLAGDTWQQVLAGVKAAHNTLYSVVRMAAPRIEEGKLVLAFSFGFHQKRMAEAANRQLIQDIVAKQTGKSVEIVCITEKVIAPQAEAAPHPTPDVPKSDTLESITNIFGGGEVLEG